MKYVVAVGDMKIGQEVDIIATHALGSCLGLMAYGPVAKVGGLLHAMLPMSKINPDKAKANPSLFVDTVHTTGHCQRGSMAPLSRIRR
jgi:chemotaxis protein CheD